MNASPATRPHAGTALHRLLDDSLCLPAEYGAGLSSHLPMALAALDGLGADEARLRAFYAHYARRFAGAGLGPSAAAVPDSSQPGEAPPDAAWIALRGQRPAFGALRVRFAAMVAGASRDVVLRGVLPLLIDGIGGVAFHGAIRTAHAVESQHAGELAAALAYWAANWRALPEPPTVGIPFDDAATWLDALDARLLQAEPGWRPSAPLISDRMQQAAGTRAWLELAGRFGGASDDPGARLLDLAQAAAARYAATCNFTVLHMATAARAARVLAPWLPADEAVLRPLWHAVAAASLASRVAAAQGGQRAQACPRAWPEVRRLACASDDDHVIKLVHAMATQDERAPHPVWLAAANAAVDASA